MINNNIYGRLSNSKFYEVLDSLLQFDENEWERTSLRSLRGIIHQNLRLINEQASNVVNASILQEKLFELSNKINKILKVFICC